MKEFKGEQEKGERIIECMHLHGFFFPLALQLKLAEISIHFMRATTEPSPPSPPPSSLIQYTYPHVVVQMRAYSLVVKRAMHAR